MIPISHNAPRNETQQEPFLSEASITITPKLDKDSTRKEDYRTISLMNIDEKFLNKILSNHIQTKGITNHNPVSIDS